MKKKKNRSNRTGWMKVIQHILITLAALALLLYIASSIVVVRNSGGDSIYNISASDKGRPYEESVFFNSIFGTEAGDVLRYVTIRHQMETDGEYDPDKIIDINAYNMRHSDMYSGSGTSAQYRLGDLIKWSKYGFETVDAEVPWDTVSGNFVNYTSYSDSGSTVSEGFDLPEDGTLAVRELLVNRYRTVDGRTLEGCAQTWDEYDVLLDSLLNCASDLRTNYDEYLKYKDYFNTLNSNIRYVVIMGKGTEREVYTNIDAGINTMNEEKIADLFKNYGRYICYDFDRMIYDTNTAVSETTFNKLMESYKYAYSDDCRIYIAADMSMPAEDGIRMGKNGFASIYLPNINETAGIIALCVIGYILLLVVCTIKEGVSYDENENRYIRLTEFDHTPIELWFIIFAVVLILFIAVPVIIASTYYESFRYEAMSLMNNINVYIIFGVVVFIFDIIMLGLYYSLVRRIKGHQIWKQSFLYKILTGCRKVLMNIYDNGNLLIRSVIPYVSLLIINLVLILIACIADGLVIPCILAALIIDAAAGVFIFKQVKDRDEIVGAMKRIISGDLMQETDTSRYHGDNKELSESVNSIGTAIRGAVEQSMKDERMKSDLVANVSHDIRTPLTSIISYVDLIKREEIDDPKVREYIDVIDEKSQRLKDLTEDLIEVSKVSSGNVELELVKINLPEMVTQALAEFDDKLTEKSLMVVTRTDNLTSPLMMADGKSLWRVMENLLGNICKYAMTGTRVFIDMFNINDQNTGMAERIVFRMRNVSESPLPEDLSDLTERFIRGDESRTSEGSGLGLSIAKSLTELMGGSFKISSEADLFSVEITFKSVD